MKRLVAALAIYLGLASVALAQGKIIVPLSAPATPSVSPGVEGSHIFKASSGTIISLYVVSGASAGFLMTFNSATVPADGSVTPIDCVPVAANSFAQLNYAPQPPEWFSTGIVAVFSTTGCFSKTVSNTAFFHALIQ